MVANGQTVDKNERKELTAYQSVQFYYEVNQLLLFICLKDVSKATCYLLNLSALALIIQQKYCIFFAIRQLVRDLFFFWIIEWHLISNGKWQDSQSAVSKHQQKSLKHQPKWDLPLQSGDLFTIDLESNHFNLKTTQLNVW